MIMLYEMRGRGRRAPGEARPVSQEPLPGDRPGQDDVTCGGMGHKGWAQAHMPKSKWHGGWVGMGMPGPKGQNNNNNNSPTPSCQNCLSNACLAGMRHGLNMPPVRHRQMSRLPAAL